MKEIGTREEVWKRRALQTSGGLRRTDLKMNPEGKIVSKKLSKVAKERMKRGEGFCAYCIKRYKESKGMIEKEKRDEKKEEKKKQEKIKQTIKTQMRKMKQIPEEETKKMRKEAERMVQTAFKIAESKPKQAETLIKKASELRKKARNIELAKIGATADMTMKQINELYQKHKKKR